jgi:hypothetical protein
MDSPALLKLAIDAFGPWKIVVTPLLLGMPVLWLCLRSGSPHILLSRLWLIFFGKQQYEDAVIQDYLKHRGALMQFRILTGVKSRTRLQAHALIKWCEDNDEEIGAVRRSRSYFDGIELKLKPERELPSKRDQGFKILAIVAFTYATMFCVVAMVQPGLFVSVKGGSGTTMILTDHQISRPFHFNTNFTLDDCAAGYPPISARTGIPENEVKTACSWLSDKQLPDYLSKGLRGQRAALFIPSAMLLWVGLLTFQWWASGEVARDMSSRLNGRASTVKEATASETNKKDSL